MQPSADSLKCRLFVALGAVTAVLVTLLGYQLGGLGQDVVDARLSDDYSKVNGMLRERSRLCDTDLKSRGGQVRVTESDVSSLRQENDLLERENELLSQTNEDMRRAISDCDEGAAGLRERRTGTREANATAVVQRLYYEVAQLEGALSGIEEEHQDGKMQMRHKIRALRLENNELRTKAEALEGGEGASAVSAQRLVHVGGEGGCADDPDALHCKDWTLQGECGRNEAYMRQRCPASCGFCGGQRPICTDLADHCKSWASRGECKSNADFMSRKCPVSCNSCPAAPNSARVGPDDVNVRTPRKKLSKSTMNYVIKRNSDDERFGLRFNGTEIVSVTAKGVADVAGLQRGMVISMIDKVAVSSHDDVRQAFSFARETTTVSVGGEEP